MNKINFFNEIMAVHDTEENKYNERVADLLLSTNNNEFDVYYEIIERLSQFYTITPYQFKFNKKKSFDRITKFTFKINDTEDDISELCKILNDNVNTIKTCYSTAKCLYEEDKEENVLALKISDIEYNFDIKEDLTK